MNKVREMFGIFCDDTAQLSKENQHRLKLSLDTRVSTDSDGIAKCLGLNAQPKVELQEIIATLESKLSDEYRLVLA